MVGDFDIDVELLLVVEGVHKNFFPFRFVVFAVSLVPLRAHAISHCIFLRSFVFPKLIRH